MKNLTVPVTLLMSPAQHRDLCAWASVVNATPEAAALTTCMTGLGSFCGGHDAFDASITYFLDDHKIWMAGVPPFADARNKEDQEHPDAVRSHLIYAIYRQLQRTQRQAQMILRPMKAA